MNPIILTLVIPEGCREAHIHIADGVSTINHMPVHQASLPRPNSYIELVAWLHAQRRQGVDYYTLCGHNWAEVVRTIQPLIGWDIEVRSLRRAAEKCEFLSRK